MKRKKNSCSINTPHDWVLYPYMSICVRRTVNSEACRGSLAADGVADGAAVLAGVIPVHWVDDQRPSVDGEARVWGKVGTTFTPCHAGVSAWSPGAA